MDVRFPSPQFFDALRKRAAEDPDGMASAGESEAYCGVVIDDQLIVMEFDGKECVAVANGGNLIDLDFALAGSLDTWKKLVARSAGHADADAGDTLDAFVRSGALEVRSEAPDGDQLTGAALPFLQAFLDQARHLEVQFEASG